MFFFESEFLGFSEILALDLLNELNGTGGKERELAAPVSSMISSTLYQPAPEPWGQKHQNQISFSPPKKNRISEQGVV